MNISTDKILAKSILVAAHPDDEVLWFSSILDKVDRIIICFLECESNSQWTIGRKKSLTEHPMSNISYLHISESGVFSDNNFRNPRITKYGIKITDKRLSDKKYIRNFYELKKHLKKRLIDYCNVFAHNPWGEYGNEEHIQVYRVVKELQNEMNFNLWFSNYCSNKSFNLMIRYFAELDSEYLTLQTNKEMANNIASLYKNNGCWTWYDDYEWCNEETFIRDKHSGQEIKNYGQVFPLNVIKVDSPNTLQAGSSIFSRSIATILRKGK